MAPLSLLRDVWAELRCSGVAAPLSQLRTVLGESTPIYIVGGFPRDLLRMCVEHRSVAPNDVDVVVDTDELPNALRSIGGTLVRTMLGGFRWTPSGSALPIDVWELSATVWMREHGLPPTIDSFLAGVDLDVNRVAVGLHDGSVVADDCYRAVCEKAIAADARWRVDALADDETARAAMVSYKTGYRLSKALRERLACAGDDFVRRAVERLVGDGYAESHVASALHAAAA